MASITRRLWDACHPFHPYLSARAADVATSAGQAGSDRRSIGSIAGWPARVTHNAPNVPRSMRRTRMPGVRVQARVPGPRRRIGTTSWMVLLLAAAGDQQRSVARRAPAAGTPRALRMWRPRPSSARSSNTGFPNRAICLHIPPCGASLRQAAAATQALDIQFCDARIPDGASIGTEQEGSFRVGSPSEDAL
jgi:hypothetical protein